MSLRSSSSSLSSAPRSARSSDRSRSHSGSPAPREDPRRILQHFRVVTQDHDDPADIRPLAATSRSFRFVALAMHFGLTMLETREGREALVETGTSIWKELGPRARRDILFRGDPVKDGQLMAASVDRYLTKIRADLPTVIVSDRIEGEGETIRLQWINVLREADYTAKMAVFFRLNKTVRLRIMSTYLSTLQIARASTNPIVQIIDNALHAAGENNANELRGFLFLMGLSVAPELIHTFIGFLTGDVGRDTPDSIRYPLVPVRREGESGNFWEGKLLRCRIQACFNPRNPRGSRQVGDMVGVFTTQNTGRAMSEAWMHDC